MREFIGHKMKLVVEDMGAVEGIMADDSKVFLLLKGNDGKITRIPKGKICAFTPMDFEPNAYIPFHVLYCDCKRTGCPGVQYVQEGEGFHVKDLEKFMAPCKCRTQDCRCGTRGELRSVHSDVLRGIFKGTLFGDYPSPKQEKKEQESAADNRAADGEAGGGEDAGFGDGEGAESFEG